MRYRVDGATPALSGQRFVPAVSSLRAADHECTGTPIFADTLLTAAHCLRGLTPRTVDGLTIATDDGHRACKDYACGSAGPTDDFDVVATDLGIAYVPGLQRSSYPTLAHAASRGLPDGYLLSARDHQALAVCRAQADDAIGAVDGRIDRGDSGSPVVAVRGDELTVVGVASHRVLDASDGRWYFVVVPSTLPWPSEHPEPTPPTIPDLDDASFDAVPECP